MLLLWMLSLTTVTLIHLQKELIALSLTTLAYKQLRLNNNLRKFELIFV